MLSTSKKISLFLITTFIAFACDKAPEIPEMGELKEFTHPQYNFQIKYPDNWSSNETINTFASFSIPEARSRFAKYDGLGQPVAKIYLSVEKIDSMKTIDTVIKRKSSIFTPEVYEAPAKTTIDGQEATRLRYSFPLNDGDFVGEFYIAAADSQTVTILQFEAFGGAFEKYHAKFDEIASSMILARTPEKRTGDTIFTTEELDPPSSTLKTISGDNYTIQIPENFKKGKSAGMYEGERRGDSYIKVETFDASKNKNLKKIAENNAKNVNSTAKSLKLGGADAYVVEYAPTGTIKRRMYYTIGGDTLYRITVDWFTGEEDLYLPVFEKSVKTFKAK